MQTDLILRRTQIGQLLFAIIISLMLPFMWQYLFQNLTITIVLTLMLMVLLLAIGLISKNPAAPVTKTSKRKNNALSNDGSQTIEEDLSNPASLWIWPVEPHEVGPDLVDLNSYDLNDSDQMMAWLEQLIIQEDNALQNSQELSWASARNTRRRNNVDQVLFFVLFMLFGALAVLWLKLYS